MRHLTRLIAAFFLTLAVVAPAAAEEPVTPEKVVKAQALYRLAMPDTVLGEMAAQTGKLIAARIEQTLQSKGKSLSEAQRNAFIARFAVNFVAMMKELEPEMALAYARLLTDEELDLLAEMYGNPKMAAIMAKLPKLMDGITPAIMERAGPMARDTIEALRREGVLTDL